jgi:glycosyltransferase involved in cell wall biosynthesis
MKHIVYTHTLPPTNVRVRKNISAFLNLGYVVSYYGINRVGHAKFYDADFITKKNLNIVVEEKPIYNRFRGFLQLIKFIKNLANFIKSNNPDIIVITNEELFLVSFFLTRKLKQRIVIDAIDALDLRSKENFIIDYLLKTYVNFVRKNTKSIVEVEEFRSNLRPSFKKKTIIVRNTQDILDLNLNLNQDEMYKRVISHKFIYCSGTLNKDINGVELLIKAIDSFDGIKIVVAGFISDFKLIKLLKSNSQKVIFLGSVSLEDSIYLLSKSLCCFAYYSPSIKNFKLAAPNKVYEAFMIGKPLLINSECLISQFCIENGFGFTAKFNNLDELILNIKNILSIENWDIKSSEIKKAFKTNYTWKKESLNWEGAFNRLEV